VPRRKLTTRERILDTLRRRGPCTVADLARRFRISTMAVRLQLRGLSREGFVRHEETRPSRGRPARVYGLTTSSDCCFPESAGPMAVEVLEEMEALAGRPMVIRALERRAKRLADAWREKLKGLPLPERLRRLATLRDEEGYLAEAVTVDGKTSGLVERHCPISALADRWPEICAIEEAMFRRALGVPVRRTEHLLTGGRCCRYEAGGEV
jgi:predicted ArsR family transcriptional regulator